MRREFEEHLLFIAGYRVGQRAGDGSVHLDRRVLRRSRQNCSPVRGIATFSGTNRQRWS